MAEDPKRSADEILAEWRAGANLPKSPADYWRIEVTANWQQVEVIRRAVRSDSDVRKQLRKALPLANSVLKHDESGWSWRYGSSNDFRGIISALYNEAEIRTWWESLDLTRHDSWTCSMTRWSEAKPR